MTLAAVALAPAYNPGPWSTFFTLTGTVAATLTGLFFVAFSLRVRDLQLSVAIRTRAAYLLALLVVIVRPGCLPRLSPLLIPAHPRRVAPIHVTLKDFADPLWW